MARASESAFLSNLSGRVGNLVIARHPDGPVLREYARPKSPQTPLQLKSQNRTAWVSRIWARLDPERVARWRAYGENPTFARTGKRPRGAGPGRGYPLFFKLASGRYRLDPGVDLLTFDPPVRPFRGDLIDVEATGLPSAVLFSSSGPNVPGVTTELLIQKLRNGNCLPSGDKYRFAAFHTFVAGEAAAVEAAPGVYACAIRFYDVQTGESKALVEIGTVAVGIAPPPRDEPAP